MRHYHTGIVIGHTVTGAWRYQENKWVSRAGDTVYEVAARRTPRDPGRHRGVLLPGRRAAVLDEDKKILWQENHKTSIERRTSFCAANGITARDLTRWEV
jgi:hypothetical protein